MKLFKQYLKGAVTIEYTLLLPILLMVYTFLISVAIYQYNECLLTTNLYLIGNQRMELARNDGVGKIELLKGRATRLYHEKYILVEDVQIKYLVKGNHIEITGNGKMRNLLDSIGIGDEEWVISGKCEQDVLNVTSVLQLYKNIGDRSQYKIPKEE